MAGHIAVILSTYNQPAHLERVLWGYARQALKEFQLIIADDGSGAETQQVIAQLRRQTGLAIDHVWHEDDGFRKTVILNRAILATEAEYLIFSDGDCIPRDDFVAVHIRHAEPNRFLSGGAVRLSQELSERITVEDVKAGRVSEPGWLRSHGWRPGRHRLRLVRSRHLATLLDATTTTGATWNGNNASTWRRHLLKVNGFDMDIGYGSEDRALGARLENLGLRGKMVRFRAPLVHLAHGRPYRDPEVVEQNRLLRKQIQREGIVRARLGLAELQKQNESTD
jgi:glycosyltransferase involved in cell wall biosynthesis